ncbi:hypothetical protein PybrP1_010036 [[Pythium] brassicae (nom. inval.)]|nr:hypothetical protein PybrP1_010036 [[Pythium] brassicae (nom. inval.)]
MDSEFSSLLAVLVAIAASAAFLAHRQRRYHDDFIDSSRTISYALQLRFHQPMWLWKLQRALGLGIEKRFKKSIAHNDFLLFNIINKSIVMKSLSKRSESPTSSMGGSSSTAALALHDVVRAREWLLISLSNRFSAVPASESEDSTLSVHTRLLRAFRRFDSLAKGAVPLEAALVIARDFTLDNKWTRDQSERFCELFKSWESDSGGPDDANYNYRLLLSFLFFPSECEPSRLKLKECVATEGALAVHPGELVLDALSATSSSNAVTPARAVPVTVKKLPLDSLASINDGVGDAVEKLRDEVNSLRLFSHPNITRYYTSLQSKTALYLVEESHPNCSLKTILASFGPMKEPTIRRYLLQMLQGLEYLHDRGIAHGIDSYGLLKLSEFGIGKQLKQLGHEPPQQRPRADQEWTATFAPPEVSKNHVLTGSTKSDVWSVGILVLQMANGFKRDSHSDPLPPPASSSSSYGQSKSSPQKRSTATPRAASPQRRPNADPAVLPTLPPTASKPLRMLVQACLHRSARKRATAEQLIKMDFFQVDAAQATNEMLRTMCTDLDASMRRLISSSAASAHSPPSGKRNARESAGVVDSSADVGGEEQ